MAVIQQKTVDRLVEMSAELKTICERAISDGRSKAEADLSSLQEASASQEMLEQLSANEMTPHEELYLHLADEKVTDAEALLAFRRHLQDTHNSDYADTLSVLTLLADLSDARFAFLQNWEQREQEGGRFLSVDKEWLDYRLFHARDHSERIRHELDEAQEHRPDSFHPVDVSG